MELGGGEFCGRLMNMVLTQSLAGVAEYTVTLPPWSWHWDGVGGGGSVEDG